MKPSVAYIQRFLKKPNGFKRTQDNLEIRVGSGKTKKLHIFFRWSQGSVRQEDKLGSVTQDTPRADIDLILKKYLELINYYNKGITPDDLRSADRKAEIDETAFQTGRATVDELFQTYFEVMLNDDSPYNRTYIGAYKNHIKPHIGKRPAEDVTRQELQAVVLKVVQADKLTMAKQIASYLPRVWRWGYRHNPDKFPLIAEVANELEHTPVEPRTRVATDEEKRHILIIGGGGYAREIINIIQKNKSYTIIGYSDPVDRGDLLGVSYLGNDESIEKYRERARYAVLGIGQLQDPTQKRAVLEKYRGYEFEFPTIISSSASVGADVEIGVGTIVRDHSVISVSCVLGKFSTISLNTSVGCNTKIGDYTNVSLGTNIGINVTIGNQVLVGVGSTVMNNIVVSDSCLIGAGSLVLSDCKKAGLYFGSPATLRNDG
jgi:UDP-perosamine 4-acetyltransferase